MADDLGPGRPRRRVSPNVVAVLVLAALGAGLLVWQQPWADGGAATSAVPADAAAALTTQFADLSAARTESDFVRAAGAGPAAAAFGAATWQARRDMGADQVSFRYLSGGDSAEFANGDTRAKVEIRWTQSNGGDGRGNVQVRMRPQDDGTFDIVSASRGSGPLPVWLAGAVVIEGTDDIQVVRIDGGDVDVDVESLAATARREVAALVPTMTSSTLTIVSAPSADVAGALLGQTTDVVSQIAAVSTGFDMRNGDLAGPVVVLNPGVFDAMDARATQVVMTHEATHVLTGAIGLRADTWVIEGFADYVALRDDDAPLSVSAGQILTQVRADGPPKSLPTAAAFDEAAYGLGAVYEAAWMVFRMLGEDFDTPQVVAFYRSVLDGDPVEDASQSAFGLSVRQITSRWQDYLTKSASTVS
ncbi:MAG: hypothetical protein WB508_02190 [Aeromicrobium sp.]|uniref:hypothetical protein n=1 Tax=Aeromicrobium sp. TaxID=1871063 RepID=UPI003C43266C